MLTTEFGNGTICQCNLFQLHTSFKRMILRTKTGKVDVGFFCETNKTLD